MAKALLVTCLIASVTCLTIAYQPECAVGPSYWCKSFQNAQDCGAVRHCTDTVWRNDEQRTGVTSSTKCEWCTKILENTHQAIEKIANHEDLIKSTLLSGCRLLPLEEVSSKCTAVIENQLATVLSLMKHKRYDRLCQLMDVCPSDIAGTDEKAAISEGDEQSKMLCNVIVRATKELQTKQGKARSEVQTFLKEDCQTLGTPQLAEKCDNLVERHGNDIYAHVASNVELSKVCDYLDSTAFESVQPVRCELCTFALAMAKRMLGADQAEDKVIRYIDEQVCSRLTGSAKKHCKKTLDSQGRDLLRDLQAGKQPMLLCTRLQLCHNEITAATSPIQKEEMRSFLTNDLCNQLGPLAGLCQAMVEKDSTRALQILANDLDGNELCRMLGLCPKTSPLLNDWALKDDPSKCKRCVRDFTRRKHIAERLVNRSSEFLQHLCGQLPQKDDCIKSVDDSISELVTFIRSLDPKAICVQLNMCDQTALQSVQSSEIVPSENVLNEEMVEYMKNDVCPRLGSSSALCLQLADSEGLNLLNMLSKKVDPHQICTVLDVCPSNRVLQNCHDKCQCCTNKVELYQAQLEKFLRAIVASTRIMCDHVPNRNTCLRLADTFESNVEKTVARFSSQRVCQMLSLCTPSETKTDGDQCGTCQTELNARQNRFRTTVKDMTADLLLQCTDSACRARVQSARQVQLNKIDELDTPTLCKRLGYCLSESSPEPSATTLRLRSLIQHQTKTLEERLRSHDICSAYGELKAVCEHLMVSDNSRRFGYVYKALLTNDAKLIDDDLREHLATSVTSDMCESCKNAVQASKDFWNNAMDTIRDLFLNGCDFCPNKDQCRDYTNKRFDDMKACVDKIDPDQFCKNLRLCATFGQKQTSTFCQNMGAFRAVCEEALSTVEQPSVDLSAELDADEVDSSNSTCIFCEYMMNMLSSYIHQDSTEEEIEQSLQKVCSQMPGTLRDQCHEMVSNYGPSIIATLIGHFDVATVCRKLNLCTKQMKVELSHITKASPASCGVCDYVSTYVNVALKRDNSDASLERALTAVCTHLSAEHSAPCRTLVELFRPNIRKMKLDLDKSFCKQLTICQTPMAELKPAMHLPREPSEQQTDDEHLKMMTIHNLDSAPQCMLCHYVVSYLDAALKNNKSEEAVQEALARVCSILPRKERVKCGDFVRTYGPVLTELITELADPGLVCRYLGMCQVLPSQESQPITYSSHRYARIPVQNAN